MSEHWSHIEVEAIVSEYFEMLAMELRGQEFNKAERNRNVQKFLNKRERGSVEFKHQNISAVLIEMGYPYIKGYKPAYNYQKSLLPAVVMDRLAITPNLHKLVESTVERPIEQPPTISDILSILVKPPKLDPNKKIYLKDKGEKIRRPIRRNYLEIESRNQSLGIAGEKLVMEFEHKRLWEAGKRDLANRIDHVSHSQGDGLGYDILSFEESGRERLIEVKTTQFGESTPFFASESEVEFSELREENYQLYRLYNFKDQPKLFQLPGSLRNSCQLDPVQYSAVAR